MGLEESAGGGSRSSTVACAVPRVSILFTVNPEQYRSYQDVLHDICVPMVKFLGWYSKLLHHHWSGRPLPTCSQNSFSAMELRLSFHSSSSEYGVIDSRNPTELSATNRLHWK